MFSVSKELFENMNEAELHDTGEIDSKLFDLILHNSLADQFVCLWL